LNVHRVSDVRQREIHTADPLVPDHSPFEVEIAVTKLKKYQSPGGDHIAVEVIQGGGETLWSEIHKLTVGEKRNAYRILVGKSEGKGLLRRPRRRWVDNIKMDRRQDGVLCTGLIRPRVGPSGGLL
jgi:hypothetical protein